MNITEDYCSYEVAKLLKEKGFDGECSKFYMLTGNGRWKYAHYHDFDISDRIDCPTLQMAMKWLREVHGIAIETILLSCGWYCQIEKILEGFCKEYIDETDSYKTYEEAVESGVKYVLENLI